MAGTKAWPSWDHKGISPPGDRFGSGDHKVLVGSPLGLQALLLETDGDPLDLEFGTRDGSDWILLKDYDHHGV